MIESTRGKSYSEREAINAREEAVRYLTYGPKKEGWGSLIVSMLIFGYAIYSLIGAFIK